MHEHRRENGQPNRVRRRAVDGEDLAGLVAQGVAREADVVGHLVGNHAVGGVDGPLRADLRDVDNHVDRDDENRDQGKRASRLIVAKRDHRLADSGGILAHGAGACQSAAIAVKRTVVPQHSYG